MKDIAEAVGVSLMTVSNVVNKKHSAVSSEVRKLVEREIRKQNYRVQSSARSLRLAEQGRIGMAIIDESESYLSHSFAHRLVSGLSNGLNAMGYTLILQGTRAKNFADSALMRTRSSDAICALVCGSANNRMQITKQLIKSGQPVVLFQENLRIDDQDICVIRQDDRGGAQTLGEHLISRGCERLAIIIPRLRWWAYEARISGIMDAIKVSPNEIQVSTVRTLSENARSTRKAISEYISRSGMPDAFVCGNDFLAVTAMQYLQSGGIAIPDDVRVTGFNAFEVHDIIRPRITTIRSSAYEMGYRAVDAIINRLRQGKFEFREIVFPVSFSPGAST